MVKSALAAFICFAIDFFRNSGLPIYAAMVAILCMQKGTRDSLNVAVDRVVGTIIGGLYGLLILYLVKNHLATPYPLLHYFILSVALLPLMYITVLIKEPSATYISCVVYLSVVVPNGFVLVPYEFAFNRILDTIIGIVVSLIINMTVFPPKQEGKFIEVISEKIHPKKEKAVEENL